MYCRNYQGIQSQSAYIYSNNYQNQVSCVYRPTAFHPGPKDQVNESKKSSCSGHCNPMVKLRNGGKRKIPQKTFNIQRKRRQICNELPLHPALRQNIPPWPCQCISVFLLDLEQTTNLPRSWLRHDYQGEGVLSAQESGAVCRTRETRSLAGELAALRTPHLQSHQHPALNHQGQGGAPGRTEREGGVSSVIHGLHEDRDRVGCVGVRERGTWTHTAVSKGHPFHSDSADSSTSNLLT